MKITNKCNVKASRTGTVMLSIDLCFLSVIFS